MKSTSLSDTEVRSRWLIVFLLFLAALINYVDRGNLSIAAVPLMRDFNKSPATMGVLLSAFFWTYAFLQVPAGYLIDRFGLKWTYGTGFLVWSAASAAIGLVTSFFQIVILRIILGAAEAAVSPASLAYIKQHFSTQEQGLPTGLFTSGMIVGPAVGALAGGDLVSRFGWRSLFILTGLGSCIWLLPWFRLAPSAPNIKTHPVPVSKAPIPLRELFMLRPAWAIAISAFFYGYYWYFCLTWLPSYLIMRRGFSFMKMGAYTALPLVAMAILSPICGRGADKMIRRWGSDVSIRKAFVCLGFVLGSSIVLLPLIKSPGEVLATLMISLGGMGLASANYWTVTETLTPEHFIGRAVGFQNMIANIAGISAPAITGWLVGETKNFALSIFFAGGALWIAASVFLILLRENDPMMIRSRFPKLYASA